MQRAGADAPTNSQINRYQGVANEYGNYLSQQSRLPASRRSGGSTNQNTNHPTLTAHHGDLTDAIRDMRGAIGPDGRVTDASTYATASTAARESISGLATTRATEESLDRSDASDAASRRIAIGAGVVGGAGAVGAIVTGSLIAWNNVEQERRRNTASTNNSTSNGNNDSTYNGTNNITNNATDNNTNGTVDQASP